MSTFAGVFPKCHSDPVMGTQRLIVFQNSPACLIRGAQGCRLWPRSLREVTDYCVFKVSFKPHCLGVY